MTNVHLTSGLNNASRWESENHYDDVISGEGYKYVLHTKDGPLDLSSNRTNAWTFFKHFQVTGDEGTTNGVSINVADFVSFEHVRFDKCNIALLFDRERSSEIDVQRCFFFNNKAAIVFNNNKHTAVNIGRCAFEDGGRGVVIDRKAVPSKYSLTDTNITDCSSERLEFPTVEVNCGTWVTITRGVFSRSVYFGPWTNGCIVRDVCFHNSRSGVIDSGFNNRIYSCRRGWSSGTVTPYMRKSKWTYNFSGNPKYVRSLPYVPDNHISMILRGGSTGVYTDLNYRPNRYVIELTYQFPSGEEVIDDPDKYGLFFDGHKVGTSDLFLNERTKSGMITTTDLVVDNNKKTEHSLEFLLPEKQTLYVHSLKIVPDMVLGVSGEFENKDHSVALGSGGFSMVCSSEGSVYCPVDHLQGGLYVLMFWCHAEKEQYHQVKFGDSGIGYPTNTFFGDPVRVVVPFIKTHSLKHVRLMKTPDKVTVSELAIIRG